MSIDDWDKILVKIEFQGGKTVHETADNGIKQFSVGDGNSKYKLCLYMDISSAGISEGSRKI